MVLFNKITKFVPRGCMHARSTQQSYGVQFTMPRSFEGSFVLPSSAVMMASGNAKPDRYCAVSWNSDKLLLQNHVRQDWTWGQFHQSTIVNKMISLETMIWCDLTS